MDILNYSLAIFLAPLAAFTFLALFHKRIPRHGDWIATGVMFFCLVLALLIFGKAFFGEERLFVHWSFEWLPVGLGRNLHGGVLIDGLTSVMLVVVCLVSFLVHLFSSKYMEGDVRYGRYYASLLLFTMSMLGLILADNILFLFVFWELVGVSSYTLIGHWFEKKSASNAAIKAFITTRIGDVGMLLGMLIIYWKIGSLQYVDVFASVGNLLSDQGDIPWLTLAGIGLFIGAMGKSAQFPLHVWLPDAMEGPTPVSALIHAATMVAAGVYLVGRLFPLFTPQASLFIGYIGGITAIFAATIAVVQDDIKKVLAYSTLSQLGYMMLALGIAGGLAGDGPAKGFVLAGYFAGLFHLTTHAFFKAGMFLGSGSVIHAMHHEQSMSKYGGLRKKLPITHATYLICVLAIIGFPLTSGFWSKDAILGAALQFAINNKTHWFLAFSGFATAFLTAFYMFRQYFLTFHGEPRDQHAYDHAHESPWQMAFPLVLLGFLALVAGGFGGSWFERMAPPPDRDGIIRLYADYHESNGTALTFPATVAAIAALPADGPHAGAAGHAADNGGREAEAEAAGAEHEGGHHGVHHAAHYGGMALAVLCAAAGFFVAWLGYGGASNQTRVYYPALVARKFQPIHTLLIHKYYFDEFYGLIVLFVTKFLIHLMAAVDKYIVDMLVNGVGYAGKLVGRVVGVFDNFVVDGSVMGVAYGSAYVGDKISYAQTGKIRNYLLSIALGVIGISAVFLIKTLI